MKIAGSGSESGSRSISQRHGSADPDPDPDPRQNVMDPQYWSEDAGISNPGLLRLWHWQSGTHPTNLTNGTSLPSPLSRPLNYEPICMLREFLDPSF